MIEQIGGSIQLSYTDDSHFEIECGHYHLISKLIIVIQEKDGVRNAVIYMNNEDIENLIGQYFDIDSMPVSLRFYRDLVHRIFSLNGFSYSTYFKGNDANKMIYYVDIIIGKIYNVDFSKQQGKMLAEIGRKTSLKEKLNC